MCRQTTGKRFQSTPQFDCPSACHHSEGIFLDFLLFFSSKLSAIFVSTHSRGHRNDPKEGGRARALLILEDAKQRRESGVEHANSFDEVRTDSSTEGTNRENFSPIYREAYFDLQERQNRSRKKKVAECPIPFADAEMDLC